MLMLIIIYVLVIYYCLSEWEHDEITLAINKKASKLRVSKPIPTEERLDLLGISIIYVDFFRFNHTAL